jgi:hypothetical protein
MPNYRPRDLTAFPSDKTLTDNDELQLSRSDGDFGLTLKQLSEYVPSTGPVTGASDLGDLDDVMLTNPANRQVLRYNTDLNPDKWVNATIAADTVTLQVSATGTATPADPLAGNAFRLPSQAIRWAKDNLRITTSLTLNIAIGSYPETAAFSVGGDGYTVILQGPLTGLATISDSTVSPTGTFLTTFSRVRIVRLTISSARVTLASELGSSLSIEACSITTTGALAVTGSDMQTRFVGACFVTGRARFDGTLAIADSARLTLSAAQSPAITFRGNAECIWGSTSGITLNGANRTVQIENLTGVRTDVNVWSGGPTFTYTSVQPVRSDIAGLATAFAASKVFNVIVVAGLPGSAPNFPGTPDPNTLYLIP